MIHRISIRAFGQSAGIEIPTVGGRRTEFIPFSGTRQRNEFRSTSMRVSAVRLVALAACLFTSPLVQAAEWKHVTTADGMPVGMVQFLKLLDGEVWMGTMDGLVRFGDGKQTKVLAEATWDVLPGGPGRYWIGTADGVWLLEKEKLTQSLKGVSAGSLERFGDQAIWAVAGRGETTGLMQYRDGTWTEPPRLKGRVVTDLYPMRNGTIWVALEADGIVAADPAQEPAQWPHHLKGVNVRSFCEDGQGRLWCGTWGKGVLLLDAGKWHPHLSKERSAITTLVEDGKGHLWAATSANGLWQYDGAQWKQHLAREGTINVLERAADGRVYISSQSVPALRVWSGKSWITLLDVPGSFRTVILGPEKKLWAGHTVTGLYIQQ